MITWDEATATLAALPSEPCRVFVEFHAGAALKHGDAGVRHQIEKSYCTGDLATHMRIGLLGAATSGIAVFVRQRQKPLLHHPVLKEVWAGELMLFANPVALALAGHWVLAWDLLPGYMRQPDLINGALCLRSEDFAKMIGTRGASPAALRSEGESVLKAFALEHPGKKMRFESFRARMRISFPLASKARIQEVWKKLRPPEWKKGGRPRRD